MLSCSTISFSNSPVSATTLPYELDDFFVPYLTFPRTRPLHPVTSQKPPARFRLVILRNWLRRRPVSFSTVGGIERVPMSSAVMDSSCNQLRKLLSVRVEVVKRWIPFER